MIHRCKDCSHNCVDWLTDSEWCDVEDQLTDAEYEQCQDEGIVEDCSHFEKCVDPLEGFERNSDK